MVKYNLDHLTQSLSQNVSGPIQDDEALFLFSIIRGCRCNRILEIGGLNGYSAKNFLEALQYDGRPVSEPKPIMFTCDINPVSQLAPNHKIIIKNALELTKEDLENEPIDMIFFDCHDMCQIQIYHRLLDEGIIHNNTILALHDTNLHYPPYQHCGNYVESEGGYAHQIVERHMVNYFKELGYDIFNIKTNANKHSPDFPVRHGITVCQKFTQLLNS